MTHKEIIAGDDYRVGAIVPVKLSDKERKLTVGCFYWVKVRVNGTTVEAWEPARFTGVDFSHNATWDYIGEESSTGHHHVQAVQLGPVIVRPETDQEFASRE